MNMTKRRHVYEEKRAELLHDRKSHHVSRLALAAQARLNRIAIARGFMGAWWDEEKLQVDLAKAYEPLARGLHSEKPLPKTIEPSTGRQLARLRKTLDEVGTPYFPELDKRESELHSWLKLQCTLADTLGYTTYLRPLERGELRRLLKLHGIRRGAGRGELLS